MMRLVFTLLSCVSLSCICASALAQAPDSSPEAKIAYADVATIQNANSFDLAAEDWVKFLTKFPQDPLVPQARHNLGACYMQLKKYPEAIATLTEVRTKHPQFAQIEDTLFNLGLCHYTVAGAGDAKSYPLAIEVFDAILKQFPMGKYVDRSLYCIGESNYFQGKKPEAIAAYSRLVKEFPQSTQRVDALYAVAVAQQELSQFAEAGVSYDLFLKDYAQHELFTEVRMRKAVTQLNLGEYEKASAELAQVATVPNFTMVDYALDQQAFCLAKLNKFPEAGVIYGGIVEKYPQSANVSIKDARLAAGRCFYRAEKFDDATKWFQQAIAANDETTSEAAHWQCRVYLRTKQAPAAYDLATKVLPAAEKSTFLVALKVDQADALYDIPERRAESIAFYAKVAAEHPDQGQAAQSLYNAAYTALELKQYDIGLQHAAAFQAKYVQDILLPDAKVVSAECLLLQNKAAEAEVVYKDLTTKHTDHGDLNLWHIRHGLALYLQKKYPEVVAMLSPLVAQMKTPEQQAEANYLMGISQFHAEKYAEAEQLLTTSLTLSPTWRQADETLLMLSRTQRKLNKNNESIGTVSKILTDFKESKLHDQARFRAGEYRYAIEDYQNSVTEYDNVINGFPQSPFVAYAQYGKAWAQLKLKDFANATQSFTKFIDANPQHALITEATYARATSRRQQGDFAGAIEDTNKVLAAANSTPDAKADALYERGMAEVAMNKNDIAVATFESVVKDYPKYAGLDKVLYELGWAYKSLTNAETAVAVFARLANEYPTSALVGEAFFHVAEDQYAKKMYEQAVKTYAQAKEKSPVGELSEKSIYKLGWSNFQLKQYEPALKEFSELLEKYPQATLATDSVFMKGECLFKLNRHAEALPVLQNALQVKLSNPAMEVLSRLHGGQAASQLKQWNVAETLQAEIIAKFADSPYIPEALYELGWAQQNQTKLEDAKKNYTAASEKSRGEVGARARFMLGEVFFEEKKYDDAIKEFQRCMYGYGAEQAQAEVKNWQSKAGYEAGRCAEVQIAAAADAPTKTKLIADAKKFYTFVLEKHAEKPEAAIAKQRIDVLSQLK
jgi:cellulose synthase operon protein C